MKKSFAIFAVATAMVVSGCATYVPGPPRPLTAVERPGSEKLVEWAKGVQDPGKKTYEVRRFEEFNGFPSTYWSAGSWAGTPPPANFGRARGYGYRGYGPHYPQFRYYGY